MSGALELRFSPEARQDLRKVGRLGRPLVSASIRDEVVSMANLTMLPRDAVEHVLAKTSLPRANPFHVDLRANWYSLSVGPYRAIVRPVIEDGALGGALVARILDEEESRSILPDVAPIGP